MRLAAGCVGLWLAAAACFGQAELPPELLLLARIKQRMADNLSRVPNYTCLETIERSQRLPHWRGFKVVDTLRLEVALVERKELFSWPGAGRFEEKPLGDLVGGGTTSTGDFALHARTVFLTHSPTFSYAGDEPISGRPAVRFDYRVSRLVGGYRIRYGEKQGSAGSRGSFWADPQTFELIRLVVHADEIPADLGVTAAVTEIDYGKVRVGESDFLLPVSVEFTMRHESGFESRNRTRFSRCRQYVGEAIFSMEETPAAAPVTEPRPVAIELPPGLTLETRLKTPIDSATTFVGDAVTAVVHEPIKRAGKLLVPKGAVLSGRVRRLERRTFRSDSYFVGLEFSTLQFDHQQARIFASLEAVGSRSPGKRPPRLIWEPLPGVSTFLIEATHLRIPAGFRMVWRTLLPED